MAWFYDAPAGVSDFTNPQVWHDEMAAEANNIVWELVATVVGKRPEEVTDEEFIQVAPTLSYVNPVRIPPPAGAETINIVPWSAFPRAVERRAPWQLPPDENDVTGIYRASEHLGEEDHRPGQFSDFDGNPLRLPVRHRQDEYCEWVVRKNPEGKITKAIFVAEGYDYFSTLFRHDEQRVVELYRDFTELNHLTADDLRAPRGIRRHLTGGGSFDMVNPGGFNPRNRFNIEPGIVHLSHRANSLGAEVNLAGVSGIARRNKHGQLVEADDEERLLCCSLGGGPNRNSDPLIGQQAYTQVIEKRRYTLANPVGLYIAGVTHQRLTMLDSEGGETDVPREWWKVVRGQDLWDSRKSRVLRLELEVPAAEGFVLGDLLVDGNPIKYGAQLAQLLSVHLFVTRWAREDGGIGPVVNCVGTCCKKTGSDQLEIKFGSCSDGFEEAFPDLV
jgi:hypothetical protein